jgi:ribonuclease BN (tRNA processing enzyme)
VSFPLTWVEWLPREAVVLGGVEATPVPVVHSSELPCFGLRVAVGGRALAFSGDTEWTDALIDLADGADLFVCECYGFDWAPPKHLDYQTLLRERDRLRSGRIYLTHLSTDMLARASSLAWPVASDGLRLTV